MYKNSRPKRIPTNVKNVASNIGKKDIVPGHAPTDLRIAISILRSLSPDNKEIIIPSRPAKRTNHVIILNHTSAVLSKFQSSCRATPGIIALRDSSLNELI